MLRFALVPPRYFRPGIFECKRWSSSLVVIDSAVDRVVYHDQLMISFAVYTCVSWLAKPWRLHCTIACQCTLADMSMAVASGMYVPVGHVCISQLCLILGCFDVMTHTWVGLVRGEWCVTSWILCSHVGVLRHYLGTSLNVCLCALYKSQTLLFSAHRQSLRCVGCMSRVWLCQCLCWMTPVLYHHVWTD